MVVDRLNVMVEHNLKTITAADFRHNPTGDAVPAGAQWGCRCRWLAEGPCFK